MQELRKVFETIYTEAINSVKPSRLLPAALRLKDDILYIGNNNYFLSSYDNIYVTGAGKASGYMAGALEKLIGDYISGGIVSVKYGHAASCSHIDLLEADHPLPDSNTLLNTEKIIDLAKTAGKNDLIINLVSGGGSSLFEKPAGNITLEEISGLTDLLQKKGADIYDLNSVRKSLSLVKGGGYLRYTYPASVVSLIISDVIGNDPATISSGPTVEQEYSVSSAQRIIKKYASEKEIPGNILKYLEKNAGKRGANLSGKYTDPVSNYIIGNNLTALKAAENEALKEGLVSNVLVSGLEGDVQNAAEYFCGMVKDAGSGILPLQKPVCIIAGGETTVHVKGNGKGGRNQEFVLASLAFLENFENEFILGSIGTDGTDGPTDAAGAYIDNEFVHKVRSKNIPYGEYLGNNDSYGFFSKYGGHIKTCPTGTNVMDIVIILIL